MSQRTSLPITRSSSRRPSGVSAHGACSGARDTQPGHACIGTSTTIPPTSRQRSSPCNSVTGRVVVSSRPTSKPSSGDSSHASSGPVSPRSLRYRSEIAAPVSASACARTSGTSHGLACAMPCATNIGITRSPAARQRSASACNSAVSPRSSSMLAPPSSHTSVTPGSTRADSRTWATRRP